MSTIKLKKTPCIIALAIIGFFAGIQVYLYQNKWVALAYLCIFLYTVYFFKKYSKRNRYSAENKNQLDSNRKFRDKKGPKVDFL